MDLDISIIRDAVLNVIIVACSLALHEWGHAIVADRLGDDTPRREGRVTLNPLVHIDLIGTLLVPFLGSIGLFGRFSAIGWAKPVQTNPANFKNGHRDRALVTIAGPAMNLFLAFVATLGAAAATRFYPPIMPLFLLILQINIALAVFNLLPIPPLDGSKFLMYWFGMSEETYWSLSRWTPFVLLVLVNTAFFRVVLGYLIGIASIPFGLLYNLLT